MNYAVASLIGQETWQRILEFLPESREIISHQKNNEFAHVSWVVSKQLNAPQVEKSLKSIARRQPPLRLTSGGVGIFGGEKPAFTLLLARNTAIDHLHSKIWKKCQTFMTDINPYYAPDVWMPHVTLLHDGLTTDAYIKFLRSCIYIPVQIEINVANLVVLFQDNDKAGMISRCDFINGE